MTDATRRAFLQTASVAAAAATTAQAAESTEIRNKQDGMFYRRLGRTNMMISEVVSGGDPIRSDNWKHLDLALDMGLNYFDMAPAYGNGDCEESYGKVIGGSSAKRMKVYLTTKISALPSLRYRLYRDIFNGLPGDKQAAIMARATEMRRERGGEEPGYFLEYFPGQRGQFAPAFLANAMAKDYAHQVEGSKLFKDTIFTSLEGSLKRVGSDHFDIVMCPHGAACAEDLEIPEIVETFQTLKKQGKVRFLGCTSHNDPAGVLHRAAELGYYDVMQIAYNVINGGYLRDALQAAHSKDMGIIAMKAAHAVATHHKALQPVPQWRIDKVDRIVPGDLKAPLKAYIWALQHPAISAVVSNLWDETYIRENLSIAGKKLDFSAA